MSETAAPFTVTPCRFADLRAIAAIQRQSFRRGLAYGYLQLLLLWAIPATTFLVARTSAGGIVVGNVIADRFKHDLRIVNIAVDPRFRRQGVATLLLDAAERAIPEGNVTLIVEEFNTGAQQVYERAGFRNVGLARNYYGRGRNGYWMRKDRPGARVDKVFV
jgi:ribosomal-protein-alanine N-acetyltransferase